MKHFYSRMDYLSSKRASQIKVLNFFDFEKAAPKATGASRPAKFEGLIFLGVRLWSLPNIFK